ncbi:MAG: Na-translocating system protein MpsC family protein [Solirubrobacterales bacterium]
MAQIKAEIAREITKVHEASYGNAASNLEVAMESGLVVAIMDIELSEAETTLIGAGSANSVMTSHEAYRAAIAPTFTAIVERATGRTVAEFTSRTVLTVKASWSVEVFRLRAALAPS